MVSVQTIYLATVGVASLLPWLLIKPVFRNRTKPGATGFLILIPSISLFCLTLGFNTAAQTSVGWYISANFLLLATNLTVIGTFLLATEYTDVLQPKWPVIGVLCLFPLLVQVLAWSNPSHHLLYPPLDSISLQSSGLSSANTNIAFILHAIFSYLLIGAAFVVLFTSAVSSYGVRRTQGLLMALGILPPIVPNILSTSGVIEYDLTPVGFVAGVFVLAWALFRADLLDVVPVGRNQAVQSMTDPVVTLDKNQRVIDANPAARELVNISDDWEGMPAIEFFAPFPEQYERFQQVENTETEITVTQAGNQRHFDLDISPIRNSRSDQQGTLIVLREITPLKEREAELDLLRQVQSRVLRHNIRNDLGVVRAYNEMFADDLDGQNAERAETVVSTIDDLVSISEKTRTVETIIDKEQTAESVEVGDWLRNIIETYQRQFPQVMFSLDAPAEYPIETLPAMEQAIENLIENAAEHNDSDTPTIEITVSKTDEETLITITDNGPGIPEHELTVLEQGEETALQHGSGVGLWVVDWVVRNSTATIEFESGEGGTTVHIRFPR